MDSNLQYKFNMQGMQVQGVYSKNVYISNLIMSDSALGEEVADYDTIHTLGVLPKFPFTLTRSIHVSI